MTDAHRRVTRVAAYALCVEGDAILLSRTAPGHTTDSDGMWTLPGGGVEFGEHPREWLRHVELDGLPLVQLARVGIGLAGLR